MILACGKIIAPKTNNIYGTDNAHNMIGVILMATDHYQQNHYNIIITVQ